MHHGADILALAVEDRVHRCLAGRLPAPFDHLPVGIDDGQVFKGEVRLVHRAGCDGDQLGVRILGADIALRPVDQAVDHHAPRRFNDFLAQVSKKHPQPPLVCRSA